MNALQQIRDQDALCLISSPSWPISHPSSAACIARSIPGAQLDRGVFVAFPTFDP